VKLRQSVVLLVLLAWATSGCQRSDYLAEKAFYNATKALDNIHAAFERSESKDPSIFEPAVRAFQNIVEKYPASPKSPEALFIISQIRKQQGDFGAAREILSKVVQNYTGMGAWAEDARFRIGQLYEEEGKWDEAEKVYWEVADYYMLKPKGMYAPIYILNHYKNTKDAVGEQKVYQRAIQHYTKMIEEAGRIELGVGIKYFLGITHAITNNWQEARNVWLAAVEEVKDDQYSPLCLLAAAEVSWKNGEKEKALEIYDQFYTNYENHPMAQKTSVRRSQLYRELGNYTKEREWLNQCIERYFSDNIDAAADIRLMIGKSFQDEGLWADAEKVYQEIEAQYPNSSAALQVPLLAASYRESQGQPEEAKKLLDDAISRYERLGSEESESPVADQARRLINEAYAMKGDWQQVLANVDGDMEKETVTTRKGSWLFLKALIAENRLGDKEQAQTLFQAFLKDYPSHPLAKLAKTHLDGLATTPAA